MITILMDRQYLESIRFLLNIRLFFIRWQLQFVRQIREGQQYRLTDEVKFSQRLKKMVKIIKRR